MTEETLVGPSIMRIAEYAGRHVTRVAVKYCEVLGSCPTAGSVIVILPTLLVTS